MQKSLQPIEGTARRSRRRLAMREELVLVLLPTVTILLVLAFVEALTEQRLLFSSLASSAFLIYLDPEHGTNSVRTLVVSQTTAALTGWITFLLLGTTYWSAGSAIVCIILLMILLDAMHPPAVATAMSFAFRAGEANNLVLFGFAVGMTAVLVLLERTTIWLMARSKAR